MNYSMVSDYDPEADISPDADPVLLYLGYLKPKGRFAQWYNRPSSAAT